MFDPTYPPTSAEIESAPLRDQFNGLKDLIDAIGTVNAATVDSVTTGNPGDPATAGVTLVGATLHFTFAIPRGTNGIPGEVTTNAMNAAISAAIDTTSANTNGVDTLDTPFADSDLETMRQKMNELILNGRR